MPSVVLLNLSPEQAADEQFVKIKAAQAARIPEGEVALVRIVKRSIDARQRQIIVNLTVELSIYGEEESYSVHPLEATDVSRREEVIIIGAGPAGLFAALRLIELGIRPVILERGKDVSSRKRDIAALCRNRTVHPDSNYCFGEGGAGTFSDGKLYTRSKKRGDNTRVLELFCYHGANNNIMYEAHPHLGTDKLPGVISNIRKSIQDAGGLLHFDCRVTDFIVEGSEIRGVVTSDGTRYMGSAVIMATGHSSREIYNLCREKGVTAIFKPFAVGVRVEHLQEHIDELRYHGSSRGKYLPPASYNVVKQVDGRGVYSFCMCPGGFIVPSATTQEGVVVNGMSPSKRNSPYANSGIVVEIKQEDLVQYASFGEYSGFVFQQELESMAWKYGGESQLAPAQRLVDFVAGKTSSTLPKTSYIPGVASSSMHEWLPLKIGDKLRKGFRLFDNSMRGFVTDEAIIIGVESRTSSPLRILRDAGSMEHVGIKRLYPCGEGSGYAGGIVSSAVDGMRVAEAIALKIRRR